MLNVFMLVHGTWGRKSPWTEDISRFSSLLKAASSNSCQFNRAKWTGKNRQTDRLLAVGELRKKLTCQFETHKHDRHFVVAHSHGGNVALAAATDEKIGSRLSGVICLNTPFLVTVQRNFLSLMIVLFAPAILSFPVSFFRNAAVLSGQRMGEWQSTLLWLKTSWPVLAASCVLPLFFLFVPRTAWPISKKNESRAVYPAPVHCPVLCIRTAGDEAFGGLGILEGIIELPHALIHPILIAVIFMMTSLAVGLGAINPLVIANPTMRAGGWLDRWSGAFSTGLLYADLVIMVAVVGILTVTPAVRSLSLGLGTAHVIRRADLTLRSTLSLVPVNARDITFVDVREAERWGLLSHSEVYNDEAVVEEIWRWCSRDDASLDRGSA